MRKDKDNTELMLSSFLSNLEAILERNNRGITDKLREVSTEVSAVSDRMDLIEKDVNFIKSEQPISRREAGRIRKRVSKRVCELLEVPYRRSERTVEQQVKYKKYSRKLFGVCYAEIPYDGNMAKSSYLDTPKGKYEDAMKDIDAFVPSSGMANFYAEADKEAIARKIAREQGYE